MNTQCLKSLKVTSCTVLVLLFTTNAFAAKPSKELICHVPADTPENISIIEVGKGKKNKSLLDHLSHGDWKVTAEMCDDIPDNDCDGQPDPVADDLSCGPGSSCLTGVCTLPPTDILLDNNSVDENEPSGTAVGTFTTTDLDSTVFTYTLVAGGGDADNAAFAIAGDQLQTTASFDFETQGPFSIRVQTDDGTSGTYQEVFSISINDVNEAPTAIALSNNNIDENAPSGTAIGNFSSTDVDAGDSHTYAFVAGAGDSDNAAFSIVTGQLQSNAVFDFETKNSYSVRVQTTDSGGLTYSDSFSINVNDVNEAPVITSSAAQSAAENQTAVATVTATDADLPAQTLSFSITGGADAASFGITTGGVLTFIAAPDFDNPGDAGSDNVYDVQVTVTDDGAGPLTDVQDIAVSVTDINEAPSITSNGGGAIAAVNTAENETAVTTVTATDPDVPAQALSFSITGGADAASFSIVSNTGVLTFNVAPDFENPTDAGPDNVYDVQVTVTDDGAPNLSDVQDIAVTVTDVVENLAPEITSDGGGATASVNAAENQTAVTTVTATDADVPAQTLTYSISGGADAALFGIVSTTGVLSFNSAPDFDIPGDANADNIYDVQVTVTDDGAGALTDVQDIAVSVTDINEAPTITSDGGGATAAVNAAENQTAVTTVTASDPDVPAQTLTFTITGGADQAVFGIAGGVLTFNAAPDFDSPSDVGANNVYDVQVTVTDNGAPNLSDVQDIAVSVTDVNEAPVITSDGGGATAAVNAAENQTAVTTVTATDTDVPAQTLTFSITGGADQTKFGIAGGVLSFNAAPDFENATDVGANNVYDVQVTVTDNGAGTLTDVQDIAVTVTNTNDDPTDIALSNNSVDENEPAGTAVGTLSTTDADTADTHTYTLVGGAGDTDNAQFSIAGNQLNTAAMLDYEAATNCTTSATTCSIRVQTSDGNGGTFQKSFIININDVLDPNAAPVATTDTYTNGIGNTNFALVASLSGTSAPPTVQLVGSVLDNDSDTDVGDILSVTANAMITTMQGGNVAIDSNGHFVYTPAAGFPSATADSFTYEVCDDGTPMQCVNGTVNITGTNMVWYVDDSSPNNPGTGTSADPFRDLSSASGPSLAGETIFVFAGTQTTGITLQNNQSLLGEGVGLTVNFINLVSAGTRPVISTAGTAVTLASGNTLRGFDITNSTAGVVGNGFGNLTANSMSISTTGGSALDLNNGAGSATFDSISSNGGQHGIVLIDTSMLGGLTVTGDGTLTQGGNDSGGIIQNTSGDGIVLTNSQDVTLINMTIGDTSASVANAPDALFNISGDGIEATGVTRLALQSVTIARTRDHGLNAVSVGADHLNGIGGAPSITDLMIDDSLILNAGDGQEEHGLNLDELRGDNYIADSLFDAFNETAIEVVNFSGQVDLTIDNTTFQDNKLTVGNAGEEAILLEARDSATIVVLVTGTAGLTTSIFDDIATQAIQALSIGSSSMIHLTVENSSFLEHSSGDGIIIMNPDGGGSGNLTVSGNTFTDDTFGPFAIIAKNDSSGTLDATIQSNTVDNMNMLLVNHDDIGGAGAANGTSRILVDNNTNNVGTNNISIDIIATEMGPVGSDPDLSVTVLNNTSTQPDNNFTFTPGLRIDGQNYSRVNANISGNSFFADPSCCGGSGVEIRELNASSVRFQGFAGGNTAAATAFMDGQNPASSTPSFLFSAVDSLWGSGTATLPTPTTVPSP